jgi:hypothetical protein
MGNQPALLMMEFAVCSRVSRDHESYIESVLNLVGKQG